MPHQQGHINLKKSPAHGGPAPHCFVAGMGADGDVDVGAGAGAVDAAAWETGSVTGGGASERGLGGGDLAALQARVPALGELAGCKVGSPEEEPGDGSSHLGGLTTGHGESAGGGGDDDGGCLDGDGGCCCCCSGGGCCCCGRGGGGGSDGLFGHGVSLEGWGGRNIVGEV